MSDHTKMMSLFVFIVMVFLLLAVRSEINARGIEKNAHEIKQNLYEQCITRNGNIERANILYAGLLKIEKESPFLGEGVEEGQYVAARIELYTQAHATEARCVEP